MYEIFKIIVQAIWLMLPAYTANPMAVVFGGGTPIDLGKKWIDGKRILGDGKTFRGLIGGTICGVIMGVIQMMFSPVFTLSVVITLSLGALLGDIAKSFIKRRLGYVRGARMPIVDQLDFVAGAWLLTYVLQPEWFIKNFNSIIIVTVVFITPVLHRLTNILGYHLKVKKEPW